MSRSSLRRLRGAGLCLPAIAVAMLLAPSAFADERFAHPMGDASDPSCPMADPCDIETAIEDATVMDGDIVTVIPGPPDYSLPMPASQINVVDAITVRAQPGGARPRIVHNGDVMNVVVPGATVRGLYLEATSGSRVIAVNGSTLEQMEIRAVSPNDRGVQLTNGAVLRDSFVSTDLDAAVQVASGGATLSGVTAIGLAPAADGVEALAGTQTIDLLNVIARGAGAGIRAEDDGMADGDALVIKTENVNHSGVSETEPEADIQLGGGTQTDAPLFVNAAPMVRDFHQLPGSPTIDAGGIFAAAGMFDFDGEARTMGCAIDIGGDEFTSTCPGPAAPAPPVTLPATPLTPPKKKCKKGRKLKKGKCVKKKRKKR